MAILEGLVILMIVACAGFVGYHAWQDSLHHSDDDYAKGHQVNLDSVTLFSKHLTSLNLSLNKFSNSFA